MPSSFLWGTLITRILLSKEVSATVQAATVLPGNETNKHAITTYVSIARQYKSALETGQTTHAKVLAAAYADAKARLHELIKQHNYNSQLTKES